MSPPLRCARQALVLLVMVGLAGCAPALQMRVPGVSVAPPRVAGMLPIVRSFERDFYGDRVEKPEWVQAMQPPMDAEATRVLTSLGADTFDVDDLEDVSGAADAYHGFRRWSEIAMLEIAAQMSHRADFGRTSVGEWRFRDGLPGWASALEADFALTLLFRDTQETTGRALGVMAGGGYTYFKQIGVACLVDLKEARMVACSARVDSWRDLREPIYAKRAVYQLLAELFGLPPPGPLPARDPGPWAIPREGRPN